MAPGFFAKALDVIKKVGKGIATVAKPVWNVAKTLAAPVGNMLQNTGNPVLTGIGQGMRFATPIVDSLLGNV